MYIYRYNNGCIHIHTQSQQLTASVHKAHVIPPDLGDSLQSLPVIRGQLK